MCIRDRYKTIYNVDYAVFINNGILSVAIKSLLKAGNTPQRTIVQTYNYDLQTGERVEIGRILSNLGLTTDEVQNKIREIVNEAAEAANILEQSGYSVFKRNLEDSMYNLSLIHICNLKKRGIDTSFLDIYRIELPKCLVA